MAVSARQFKNARAMLPPNVRVIEMSNDDAWMRDCGPNFVINDQTGEVRGVDWIFKSWVAFTFPGTGMTRWRARSWISRASTGIARRSLRGRRTAV